MQHRLTACAISALGLLASLAGTAPAAGASDPADSIERAERAWQAGRPVAAADAWREALEALHSMPSGPDGTDAPEAELALRRLRGLLDSEADPTPTRQILEPWVAEAPGIAPELRDLATYYLGELRLREGAGVEAARQVWSRLGFLEAWHVVGPFDNERGGGFDTRYGPEKELERGGVYEGKKREVRWRELPRRPIGGDVDLNALFVPDDECLAYALTFVRADAPAEALLRLGTGDGYKVWVNGRLRAESDLRRRRAFDQDAVAISLREGWNVILLKVAETDGSWGFIARLTGRNGGSLEGVSEAKPPDDWAAIASAPATGDASASMAEESSVESSVDAALDRRLAASATDARAWYLRGALLLERRAHDETEHPDTEALRRAVELDDSRPAYHYDLARSHRREGAIAADRDDNAWRRSLEAASRRQSALASWRLGRYYLDTFGNSTRALSYARRALRQNPDFVDAILLVGDVEAARSWPEAHDRALDRALAVAPDRPDLLRRQAGRLERSGDVTGRLEILTSLLKAHCVWDAVRWSIYDDLVELDRVDQAVALAKEHSTLRPFSTAAPRRLAKLWRGRDETARAVESLDRLLEVRPEDHAVLELRGRLLLEADRREDALASWDRSLDLQPNQPDLRERVEFLRTDRSRFEDEFRRDLSTRIGELVAREPGAEADDPARVLLDLTAIQVNQDGTTREFSQTVIRILNDRGVRMFDRFGARYATSEQVLEYQKARVHHPDGSVSDAELSRHGGSGGRGLRQGSVDLPPLSPGDIVEVEYVREDIVQSFFGDYFGHREIFRSTLPVDEKVLVLRGPTTRTFHFHRRNFDVDPVVEKDEESGTTTWTWTVRDIPRIDPEPGMPPSTESFALLEISTFESWADFSSWYHNLIRKQFESSPDIQRKVRELVSGKTSREEKIRAIYEYVVTEIRYNAWEFGVHGFKPYNAAAVFARKFGDCKDKATLITVMLREAGIDSEPVLIRAGQPRGEEDLTLPMVEHFNHCISHVPATDDADQIWLDGTAIFHSMEELPSMDRGGRVLLVRPQDAEVVTIPWNRPEDLSIDEEWRVTVAPDLSARVEIRIEARGDFAVGIRRSFEIAAQRRTNLERAFGRRFAGVTVAEQSFSDLLDLGEPVRASITLNVPDFVKTTPEGPSIAVPEDFFRSTASLANVGGLESRRFDVLLGNPRRTRLRATISLPEGYTVRSVPPERSLESRFGRFILGFEQAEDRALRLERRLELTSPRVSVADYDSFREFVSSLGRLDEQRIILETTKEGQ